jgi:hypothetical protein
MDKKDWKFLERCAIGLGVLHILLISLALWSVFHG